MLGSGTQQKNNSWKAERKRENRKLIAECKRKCNVGKRNANEKTKS